MRRLLAAVVSTAFLAVAMSPRAHAVAASDYSSMTFTNPTTIGNGFVPMSPGLILTYRGTVRDPSGSHDHRVVFIVTGVSKVIDGVTTRVIWEIDSEEGELQESELAFEAQDDRGDVWNMGEYPEEYDDGVNIGAPSTWIQGIGDAHAGILMQTRPGRYKATYVQGSSPSVQFRDLAKLYKTDQYVCTRVGCFSKVIVIKEWNAYEPDGGYQLKYYAPHIGVVRVTALGGVEREVLRLVKRDRVSQTRLDEINQSVLEMDQRGRATNTTYAQTPAAVIGP